MWNWFLQDPLSIPRALLLLNYIIPSPVDYGYNALWLLGTIPIFMMFYALIPLISRYIKTLEGAFLLLIAGAFACRLVGPLYLFLFGGFCHPDSIVTMTDYFVEKLIYFFSGVMIFYGKRDQRIPQMLLYQLFFLIAGMRYSYLKLDSIATFPILAAILICFPLALPQRIMKPLRWLDDLGMGVLVVQFPIFYAIRVIRKYLLGFGEAVPQGIWILPFFILPYLAAIILHYFVELPGQKLVDKLMDRAVKPAAE